MRSQWPNAPGADDYLVTAHGEGQLGARLKNVGIGPLGPLRWPGVMSLFTKAHVFDRALQVQGLAGSGFFGPAPARRARPTRRHVASGSPLQGRSPSPG